MRGLNYDNINIGDKLRLKATRSSIFPDILDGEWVYVDKKNERGLLEVYSFVGGMLTIDTSSIDRHVKLKVEKDGSVKLDSRAKLEFNTVKDDIMSLSWSRSGKSSEGTQWAIKEYTNHIGAKLAVAFVDTFVFTLKVKGRIATVDELHNFIIRNMYRIAEKGAVSDSTEMDNILASMASRGRGEEVIYLGYASVVSKLSFITNIWRHNLIEFGFNKDTDRTLLSTWVLSDISRRVHALCYVNRYSKIRERGLG